MTEANRHRQRGKQSEREADRQSVTEANRHRGKQSEREADRQSVTEANTHRGKQSEREADRQSVTEANRHRGKQSEREADRQSVTEANRHRGKQSEREADRQSVTEANTHRGKQSEREADRQSVTEANRHRHRGKLTSRLGVEAGRHRFWQRTIPPFHNTLLVWACHSIKSTQVQISSKANDYSSHSSGSKWKRRDQKNNSPVRSAKNYMQGSTMRSPGQYTTHLANHTTTAQMVAQVFTRSIHEPTCRIN